MMVSQEMVEAAARADASYAGRTFDALASSDKVRFMERAKLILEAALSTYAEPVKLSDDERRIGVIRSSVETGNDGKPDSRVSVKQYQDNDSLITISMFMGNHQWIEGSFTAEDAAKIASVIIAKPAVAALYAEPVAWRSRHSAQENWYYSDGARSWWECQPLYAAPTVAEPVKTAPAVAVKALEWKQRGEHLDTFDASIFGLNYVVTQTVENGDWHFWIERGVKALVQTKHNSVDAAKAAAQADYEARILSALSAQVQNVAAYLYTSKSTGGSLVGFKPLEQTSLRHDEWICEPLYRGGMKETVNAS